MFYVPLTRRVVARPTSFDHRVFDDAFDRLFSSRGFVAATPQDDRAPARRPAVDVTESDANYVVTLDVPGVSKEDVQVSVEGRHVSIVAEAAAPSATLNPTADAASTPADTPVDTSPKPAAPRALVSERLAARYARSFTLPADIEQGAAQARLENGVLTVTLPKRAANVARLTIN